MCQQTEQSTLQAKHMAFGMTRVKALLSRRRITDSPVGGELGRDAVRKIQMSVLDLWFVLSVKGAQALCAERSGGTTTSRCTLKSGAGFLGGPTIVACISTSANFIEPLREVPGLVKARPSLA
ncbi:hypothetical protein CSUI_009249 [Cystoisospora suis]|uniref:Uncharacterized protein n=1 Tax=Cystoisospora suis TaxID=483139 RepID=A0A2C6K4M5_9APIC|nr:hypothetical protein CSUI_009249 [Cystoisospora suis]